MAKSTVICDRCGKKFKRENRQINYNRKNGLPIYCSSSCSAKAAWKSGKLDHLKTGRSPDKPKTIANRKRLQREWYQRNKERLNQKAKLQKQRIKELIDTFKTECKICGEKRKPCLVFHHRNPQNKTIEIASMAQRGFGTKKALEEIKKCDVLCANCHRWLHYQDGRWVSK